MNTHETRPAASRAAIRFNLRQLEIFSCVAECGSIREAAGRLQLTQPAASNAVRELERLVGAELFQRSVKGVTPTVIGQALLQRALRVLNEVQRAQDELGQLLDEPGGRLCIGVSSAASVMLLPQAITAFRAQRPGVNLEVHELNWPALDERWKSGSYDFAILSELPQTTDDGLLRERLYDMPLAILARRENPLCEARSIKALEHATWMLPGIGLPVLRPLFKAAGRPPPQDVINAHSTLFTLGMLYRTDAVSLMAAWALRERKALEGLVAIPIEEPLPSLRVSVAYPDRASLTPLARQFIQRLHQSAKTSPYLKA